MDRFATSLVLCGILLLAFVLRAATIDVQSLFIDEIGEITLAKKTTAEIIVAADSAPPLFPLALKSWFALWPADAAARWFSLVCGLASIVCVWGIGRELVDNATGLAAAFIAAILPMHVFYSQFVRSYSLMFLLVSLALWLLLGAAGSDRWRDWIWFAIVATLGAYVHYYFAIFLATSVIVVALRRRQLWIGNRALAAYVGIGLAAAPLLWLLPGDLAFQKNIRDPRPISVATIGYTYFSLFSGYSLGPSTADLQAISGSEAARAAAPWIAALGLALAILGYHGWRRLQQRQAAITMLVLLLVPVLVLSTLSIAGGLNYNVRFVTWIMIAAVLWLGAGAVESWRKWPVQLAFVALVAISGFALYNRNFVARYQNEDLRGAAMYLRSNAAPKDAVYVISDYLTEGLRYYLGPNWQLVELPEPGVFSRVVTDRREAGGVVAAVESHSPPGSSFWLVYSRPFHGDPQGLMLDTLSAGPRPIKPATTLPGVRIFHSGP